MDVQPARRKARGLFFGQAVVNASQTGAGAGAIMRGVTHTLGGCMNHSNAHRIGALLVLVALATAAGATTTTRAKTGESRSSAPTSVRFIDAPSSESPAARRARLQRECKGRPNAGACLGHTGR